MKRSLGHAMRNTGCIDPQFPDLFGSSSFSDMSFSDWLAPTPRLAVAQHLNVEPPAIGGLPTTNQDHAGLGDRTE
jgi:hypothetical protein